MKVHEFNLRLKEFQLTGVVDKTKEGWVIRPETHRYESPFPLSLPDFGVGIKPVFSARGSRIKEVGLAGYDHQVEGLRKGIGAIRKRRGKPKQKPLTPNQLFDILGKIARGELDAP